MRKVILIGGALLLVGAATGWLIARPAYHRYQERHWVRAANLFLNTGDYRAAELSASRALKRNPRNVEACRVKTRVAEVSHAPELLAWRRRLAELEPTADNKLALASCALRQEPPPFPLASEVLDQLRSTASGRADFHMVAAERDLRLRNTQQAEEHLQAAARLDPTNQLYRMNLAVLRLESPDPAIAREAQATLERLVTDPSVALNALRSLVANAASRNDPKTALRWSSQLLRLTNAAFSDQIQHLSLLQNANSQDFERQLAATKVAAQSAPVRIAELAAWMNGHGRAAEAAAWITSLPSARASEPPVAIPLSQAYLLQNDGGALLKNLRKQDWADQEHLRFAMLAWASQAEGDETMKVSYWKRALQAASAPECVPVLVNAAQGWGWTTEAEQLLWLTARTYPSLDWPLHTLEQAYYRAGDTRGLLRVYAAILQRHPDDPVAKNDVAAVSLLLKTNVVRAHALARESYQQSPTNPLTAATYAFSLYLQGKAGEGLQILAPFAEEQRRRPAMAATYALLLKAAGAEDQAKTYKLLAERGPLLPEERRMLGD